MNILKIAKQIRQTINEMVIAQDSYDEKRIIDSLVELKDLIWTWWNLEVINELLLDINNSLDNQKQTFELLYEYSDVSIKESLKEYFQEILLIWKRTETISYNEYLDIKIDELNFYIWNPLQDVWFSIQEEVSPYSYQVENKKSIATIKHPFGQEILDTLLIEIFNNGSDYCDQDIAAEIIENIRNNKKI